MNRKIISILIGVLLVVLGLFNFVKTMEYYWLLSSFAGVVYVFRGVKNNEEQ